MTKNREDIRLTRTVAITSVIGGLVLGTMGHRMFHFTYFHSLYFGNISHWPAVMHRWLPLDLLATCLFFWTFMYMVTVNVIRSRNNLKIVLGVLAAIGATGGLMGSEYAGWYAGMEYFTMFFMVATVGLVAISSVLFAGHVLTIFVKQSRSHYRAQLDAWVPSGPYIGPEDDPEWLSKI